MKRIVFDFDGTLLNSSLRHSAVLKDCLSAYGYSFSREREYLQFKFDGLSTFKYLQMSGIPDDICKIVTHNWIEKIETKEYLSLDRLYDDSIAVLTECSKNSIELFLISSRSNEKNLLSQLSEMNLNSFFIKIFCVPTKHAMEKKAEIISIIEPDLVVGDTEVDYGAAVQAKVPYYILNRGFRSKTYWDNLNVQSHESLYDLLTIIRENRGNINEKN